MRTFVIHFLVSVGIVHYFFELNPGVPPNASNAFLGLLVTLFLLWLLSYFYDHRHFQKLPKVISLFFYFLRELAKANFKIAYDVLTPTHHMNPGVIVFPMKAESDLEITLLSTLISLTPGTLTIDVSEDRRFLYFHAMYIEGGDTEKVKEEVRNGFEKKILEVTR